MCLCSILHVTTHWIIIEWVLPFAFLYQWKLWKKVGILHSKAFPSTSVHSADHAVMNKRSELDKIWWDIFRLQKNLRNATAKEFRAAVKYDQARKVKFLKTNFRKKVTVLRGSTSENKSTESLFFYSSRRVLNQSVNKIREFIDAKGMGLDRREGWGGGGSGREGGRQGRVGRMI